MLKEGDMVLVDTDTLHGEEGIITYVFPFQCRYRVLVFSLDKEIEINLPY